MVGLNREELAEFRLDHLAPFRLLRRVLPLLPADSDEAREIRALFEQADLPRAQYTGMMRAFLSETP